MGQTTDIDLAAVGARLLWHIGRHDRSRHAFAKRTGIPWSSLDGYLHGRRGIPIKALALIAGTGVDLHWLVTGRLRPSPKFIGATEDETVDLMCHLIGKANPMTRDEFEEIDKTLSCVIENPADYSEFQVDFAMRNADRLGRFREATVFTAKQRQVIDEIQARTDAMEGC